MILNVGKIFKCYKIGSVFFLGVILLDTICLSDTAGKKTPIDVEIITKLEDGLPPLDRKLLFDSIQKAKTDITGLNEFH